MVTMTFTGILIRFVCLIALMEGTAYGLGLLSGGKGDANIGAGVMAFFALLVASGAWAFMDGRKHQSVGRLLVSWFVVAMLVGVAAVIVHQPSGVRASRRRFCAVISSTCRRSSQES